MLSPYDADLLSPTFIERKKIPLNAWRQVTEYGFGGWVDVQGGGYEVEAGWLRREMEATEVAVALELAKALLISGLQVVMADANPVVEALQGEMEVVVGFEFDDGEAAVGGDAEEVEEPAVGGSGDGGDLGVDVVGVEVGDGGGFGGGKGAGEWGEVVAEDGFQPSLGGGAIEGVLCGAGAGVAGWAGDFEARVGWGCGGRGADAVGGGAAAKVGGGDLGAAAGEEVGEGFGEGGAGLWGDGGFVGAGADGEFECVGEAGG